MDDKWHTATIGIEIAAGHHFFCQRCERPAIWFKRPFKLKCGCKHEWDIVKGSDDGSASSVPEVRAEPLETFA